MGLCRNLLNILITSQSIDYVRIDVVVENCSDYLWFLLPNSKIPEHLKYFKNVSCVVTNQSKHKDK